MVFVLVQQSPEPNGPYHPQATLQPTTEAMQIYRTSNLHHSSWASIWHLSRLYLAAGLVVDRL